MNTEATNPSGLAPRSVPALWVTMLGPPLVWLTQFEIKYALAGLRHVTHFGALDITVALLSLGIVGGLAVVAWGERRRAAASPLDAVAGVVRRNRFMADLALMSCALFFLLIVAQAVPDFFFVPGKT